jgi:hypothetical protein
VTLSNLTIRESIHTGYKSDNILRHAYGNDSIIQDFGGKFEVFKEIQTSEYNSFGRISLDTILCRNTRVSPIYLSRFIITFFTML